MHISFNNRSFAITNFSIFPSKTHHIFRVDTELVNFNFSVIFHGVPSHCEHVCTMKILRKLTHGNSKCISLYARDRSADMSYNYYVCCTHTRCIERDKPSPSTGASCSCYQLWFSPRLTDYTPGSFVHSAFIIFVFFF